MLDGMTADKPKRKPAGAAVPGAVDRPVNYPHSLVVLVSDETREALEREKQRTGLSKGAVARDWLERGRLSAG